jgi:hypothetical protein
VVSDDGAAALATIELTGGPIRATEPASFGAADVVGLVGVDVAAATVDGAPCTAAQLLFDDDVTGFDRSLLDAPIAAELLGPDGGVVTRELFDHDRFRRTLLAERAAGERITRGVLLLTGGELPPPWVRLSFLSVPLADTRFHRLVVRRTTVGELQAGVEAAHAAGDATDDERRAVLTALGQLHPS